MVATTLPVPTLPAATSLPTVPGLRFAEVPNFPGYAAASDGHVWIHRGCWHRLTEVYDSVWLVTAGGATEHRAVADVVRDAFPLTAETP